MNRVKFGLAFILILGLSIRCTNAINCVTCDSSKTGEENCAIAPQSLTSADCETSTKCFTKVDGESTKRGCLATDDTTCTDTKTCETCEADNCNKEIFPKDRIQCVTCDESNAACYEGSLSDSKPCVKLNDQCALAVLGDGKANRGCASDDKFKDCDKTPDSCKKCTGNGCNKDISSTVSVTCVSCSSSDGSCKRNEKGGDDCKIEQPTKECKKVPLGAEKDEKKTCYTYKTLNTVERGCAQDQKEGSEICDGINCNTKCTTDLKCHQCNSKEDPKCGEETVQSAWVKECPAYTTGCARCVDKDGVTTRSCAGSEASITSSCSYCNENECGPVKPKLSCFTCNSLTDPKCAQWTDENNKIKVEQCGESDVGCLTIINDDKSTERRCLKNDEKIPEGKDHETCDTVNCNGGLFPKTRINCYQCSGSDCADIEKNSDKIKSLPCPLYDRADECFTYGASNTDMTRGCKSAADEYKKCTDTGDKCLTCGNDNCNRFTYVRSQEVKCVQCTSSDVGCAWGQNKTAAKDCAKTVPYNSKEKELCYIKIEDDAKTKVERGCTLDLDTQLDCSKAENKCETCEGTGCNVRTVIDYTCIRCRTDNPGQQSCSVSAEGIAGSACTKPVLVDSQGCYTEKYRDIVIRGCLADLIPETKANCVDEKYKLCDSCTDSVNCNNKIAPNAATNLGVYSGLIAAAVALHLTYY